jgi:hypothetical protein
VYIYTYLSSYRSYMNYRSYQIKLWVKHFLHKSGAVRS